MSACSLCIGEHFNQRETTRNQNKFKQNKDRNDKEEPKNTKLTATEIKVNLEVNNAVLTGFFLTITVTLQ
jgi:hypothetical protein